MIGSLKIALIVYGVVGILLGLALIIIPKFLVRETLVPFFTSHRLL